MKKYIYLILFLCVFASCKTKSLLPSGFYSQDAYVFDLAPETVNLDIFLNDSIIAFIDTERLKGDTVITLGKYSYIGSIKNNVGYIIVNTLEKYRNSDLTVSPQYSIGASDSIEINIKFDNLVKTSGKLYIDFINEKNEYLLSKEISYNPAYANHISFNIPQLRYNGNVSVIFRFFPSSYKPYDEYLASYNGLIFFNNSSCIAKFEADPRINALDLFIKLSDSDIVRQAFINRLFMIFVKGDRSYINLDCEYFYFDKGVLTNFDYKAIKAKVNEAIVREIP